jgi:choline kinase
MARFFGRNDMQALIFNSGLGSRLGHLTENRPKSMVELGSGGGRGIIPMGVKVSTAVMALSIAVITILRVRSLVDRDFIFFIPPFEFLL